MSVDCLLFIGKLVFPRLARDSRFNRTFNGQSGKISRRSITIGLQEGLGISNAFFGKVLKVFPQHMWGSCKRA